MNSKFLPNSYYKYIDNLSTFDFTLLDNRVDAIELELSNTDSYVQEDIDSKSYSVEELRLNKKLEDNMRAKIAILVLSDMVTKIKISNEEIISLFKFNVDQILLIEELMQYNNYEGDYVLYEDLFFIVKLVDKLNTLHEKDIELEIDKTISMYQKIDKKLSEEDINLMKDYYTINSKNNINKIDIEIEARRIYKDSLSDTKYSSVKDLSVMQTLIEDFKSRNELKSQLFKRIIENAIGFARINNLYMIHIKFILLSLIFDILNANSPLQAEISPLDEILFTR
jgi:hypothetical protein